VRQTLAELEAHESSCKLLMESAGQVCMSAWVTALEASKEYRRVRKEWRRARAKMQKRQGKKRTLDAAPMALPVTAATNDEADAADAADADDDEQPAAPRSTTAADGEDVQDQVAQIEHAVQVLQSAQVEAEEASEAESASASPIHGTHGGHDSDIHDVFASFASGQLCLRTSVAAPDALSAERALEGLVDDVLNESADGFHESQRLLEEQQRRYSLELQAHEQCEGGLTVDIGLAAAAAGLGEPLSPLLEEEDVAEEAELLQLTIESEQIKRQLAATEAEEAALRAEEEQLLREQAAADAAVAGQEEGQQQQPEQEDEVELENFVVSKPLHPRRTAAVVVSTLASTAAQPSNGVLLFSPPRSAMTAAQRKAHLASTRAQTQADKERRAALKGALESDLALHEERRQQLLQLKADKALEAERRRQAAKDKVEAAERARRNKFAKVVQAAASIEEARRVRHAEEVKLLRAQAKQRLIKEAAAAAAASAAAAAASTNGASVTGESGETTECDGTNAASSGCEGCARCSAARLALAEERRRKHLAELQSRCTNDEDLARHRAAVVARDALEARAKSALLEDGERRRLEAETRRANKQEAEKQAKLIAREKKRKELEEQLQAKAAAAISANGSGKEGVVKKAPVVVSSAAAPANTAD
jgi:hypothetical protein